ncbi:glycosyltransferase [Cytophagaceae bacterium 50C-KIRBA]|uniref:Glycosyltransferase n=1 Tax=Aquirufa beregesia TaxID=2516556 RepID=A0ABX0EZF4_9BACT|nr:glycosyltransferase [Aquirufa beregesia]NGZ44159.1 glycosyltransferase [Aquirufa beregesia]
MPSKQNNNKKFPLISIVMACYRGEKFVVEQIQNHLNQDYPHLEFIYLDDASTDTTWAILQDMAHQDERIKIFQNEENLGYVRSFEKAMQLAQGEWIALSDQDDLWEKQKLSRLYQAIGPYSMIYADSQLIDEAGNALPQKMSDLKNQIPYTSPLMYTFGAWAPGHSMLFQKSILTRAFPFPHFVSHDYYIGFLATCFQGINYLPETLVHYRQHDQNAIGANLKKAPKQYATRKQRDQRIQQRVRLLAEFCPAEKALEKQILRQVAQDFCSSDLIPRIRRTCLVLKYRDLMLAYKKKGALAKWLYPFKLLFSIY